MGRRLLVSSPCMCAVTGWGQNGAKGPVAESEDCAARGQAFVVGEVQTRRNALEASAGMVRARACVGHVCLGVSGLERRRDDGGQTG